MSDIISDINKHVKSDVGTMATDVGVEDSSYIYKYSTGILSLDRYLGVGGLLGGRVMNLWGWEGSGKTLTALTVAASIQRQGGKVAFCDAENTYSPDMARSVGVNTDELALFRSTPEKLMTGEDYFAIINILIQNQVDFIIVDSVPALIPSSRLTATIGQGQKATQAQMLSEGLQQVTAYLNSSKKSILWLINQIRMKPMVQFGRPEDHTGGASLKFYASYSMEVTKRSKDGDITKFVPAPGNTFREETIGVRINARLHKNKTASIPVNGIDWDVYFRTVTDRDGATFNAGVDIYKDVFNTAESLGIIKKQSSWYSWDGIKENGEDAFISSLRAAGPDAIAKIRQETLTLT